jgi:chemotaxis signal transduction protein
VKVIVFEVGGRNYGLPADVVRQIDEASPVTPLPFVPDYVEGLTASAGKVLPQIDLALRLGLPSARTADSELVVVAASGGETVFRIGHARRMIDVSDEDLIPVGLGEAQDYDDSDPDAEQPESAKDDDLLSAQFQMDGEPVLLLRPEAIGIGGVTIRRPAENDGSPAMLGEAQGADTSGRHVAAETDVVCLAVDAGKERYAFPLEVVSEIYTDTDLTPLPNAPAFIGGISVLRGMPRLVVSLSRLLGVPVETAESNMVAVTVAGMQLVFQCTSLQGIRRFAENRRENAGDRSGCIDCYLVGEEGSITALLSMDGLIDDVKIRQLRAFLPKAVDGRDGSRSQGNETRRVLLVRAGAEVCGIPVDRIERVAGFSAATEMPGATGIVVGMTDVSGRVVPVADLGAAFGGPRCTGAYVVVRTSREDGFGVWALAVDGLERLTDVPVASIRSTSAVVEELIREVGRVGDRLISIVGVDALEALSVVPTADGAETSELAA